MRRWRAWMWTRTRSWSSMSIGDWLGNWQRKSGRRKPWRSGRNKACLLGWGPSRACWAGPGRTSLPLIKLPSWNTDACFYTLPRFLFWTPGSGKALSLPEVKTWKSKALWRQGMWLILTYPTASSILPTVWWFSSLWCWGQNLSICGVVLGLVLSRCSINTLGEK